MEVSTSRATPPGKSPGGWRGFQEGVTHFLEAIGEILHGMDEARQAHPIISSCRVVRR